MNEKADILFEKNSIYWSTRVSPKNILYKYQQKHPVIWSISHHGMRFRCGDLRP